MTTATRRYFTAPDAAEDTCLWFGTDTEHQPRLVAVEGGTLDRGNAVLPAELFRLVATVLAPTDEDVDRLADAIWGSPALDGWPASKPTDAHRATVRIFLRALAGDVLA